MLLAPSLLFLAISQAGTQPARLVVQPDSVEIAVDGSRQLEAVAYDHQGNPIAGVTVRWISSDPNVVRIDQRGSVTAVRPGRARIRAVAGGREGSASVLVRQLPPARIALDAPEAEVLAKTSMPLVIDVRTSLGDELPRARVEFESTSSDVASVDESGRVYAHRPGTTTIRARAGSATAEIEIRVRANTAVTYRVEPDPGTVRTGDVVRFRAAALTDSGEEVGTLLPAWALYGPRATIEAEGPEGVFVAEEPGIYRVTALIGETISRGTTVEVVARSIPAQLVKVGRGAATDHHSGDTWVFEGADGRDYAYIGTYHYDWMKVWDVTDPSNPVLTDSVQVDARRINDVKIHPNNRLAIITREGASNRRNGIVVLDLSEPAHPTILSEFTDSLTGGVHNVWIRGDEHLVYACHNGTYDLHIIDISDPHKPHQVGRWGLDKPFKTLHDVIVQDGYAYLSYWDDGAIMLDVGAGTHGGTPTEPVLVSQFKYPIGQTHTAWRHGRYLYVGDEIFPNDWNPDRPIEARGYVHVLDYSDPKDPREVARFEVPEAGAHNMWVEGDRLYIGYYQAGIRVVDISGELRGDLYRQGREIAVLKTIDSQSVVPNWPMAWSAQLYKGHIFSADLNSGLWVMRLDEERPVP